MTATLLLLLLAAFVLLRGRALLLYFQQEEYDGRRFLRYLKTAGGRDRIVSLAAILAGLAGIAAAYGQGWGVYAAPLLLAAGLIEGARRSLPVVRDAKKPLVMTARAKRIFQLYAALTGGLAGGLWVAAGWTAVTTPALVALVAAQAAPFLLVAGDRLLSPFERRVKARFRQQAVDRLAALGPVVIGITGSFGKTSTKHLLSHVLSAAAPTLATPGSVNTEMGITRIIREKLEPKHRYFIVEMGAYGPGSIARLCRLTPPDHAIVTAVGDAHYERFKSIAAVFQTKFELAAATRARGGATVIHRDGIPAEFLDPYLARHDGLLTVGAGPDNALRLADLRQTAEGLELEIVEDGGAASTLRAPVYGRHQAGNILCVVALARRLGLPMDSIRAALATAPQTRHRLEVSRSGGIAVIDDAYNSNPAGFAAGLELLDLLAQPGGRRIVITPGMVELGARHDSEHARLGALTARHADILLAVTPQRIPTFTEAFRGAAQGDLLTFDRQAGAEAWIAANARPGDAVLYENNLPDLYERPPRF